jgi:hypothetical protein
MTKQQHILNALLSGTRMTHLKALAYSTHRLAAHIFELRKKGYPIQVEERRDDNNVRFAEYFFTDSYLATHPVAA